MEKCIAPNSNFYAFVQQVRRSYNMLIGSGHKKGKKNCKSSHPNYVQNSKPIQS